ncbi:MAG TPA: hypothetical protein VH413_05720 [Verrucomicrobiae bacterium]|jgi:hypothetical protein|nr:hypothetical protein [Verrucomicrobiae bacterium]
MASIILAWWWLMFPHRIYLRHRINRISRITIIIRPIFRTRIIHIITKTCRPPRRRQVLMAEGIITAGTWVAGIIIDCAKAVHENCG